MVGQHQRRVGLRVELLLGLLAGGQQDAALQRLAVGVELIDVSGEFLGAVRAVGDEQLDGQQGLAESTGGIQPRPEREADVLGRQPRLVVDLGDLHEGLQARAGPLLEAHQAVSDQGAILVDQRHHVGHGAHRRQTGRLKQKRLHPLADALGRAGLLADRPGEFEGHARAAQTAERIVRAGQPGMDDRGRPGKLGPRLVVVGDDQFQATLAGGGGLVGAA